MNSQTDIKNDDAIPGPATQVIDYEGSDYRERFWVNADRQYEDLAERKALKKLLPTYGRRLVDLVQPDHTPASPLDPAGTEPRHL